ncbi:hypothetical protein [Streptomyces sp. W16]|uniref:hypothetical protein n=1 Tax=unclassified Streptomyces TaxID=2593676 RepID=UPI00295BFC38|nr:hypothetical protein [Streptomyces sp. W16]MDV9171948.1 hypothetical protein [Streptomyces sp. W16]
MSTAGTTQQIPWTSIVLVIIGISTFVSGLVTITWNFVSWRWSGANVKPTVSFLNVISVGSSPVPVICITAANKGRGSCQVTTWWFEDSAGMGSVIINHEPGSAPLPVTLDGLHEVSWMVQERPVVKSFNEKGVTRIRPVVKIGSGKQFEGEWIDVPTAPTSSKP